MKTLGGYLLIGAGLFLSLNLLHATPPSLTAQPLAADDLSAMVEAVAQTTPTPAAEVPDDGKYYSAQAPDGPPLPGNMGHAAWNLGDNVWLLDDLDTGASAPAVSRSSLSRMSANDISFPGDGGDGGDGGTNSYTPSFSGGTPINTNLLYLEMTNDDGNFAYLNLMNGTDSVYCVESASALPGGWNIETELFPTGDQTNVLPFTVQTLGRQSLFLRAMDWTGVTENGNTTPDWWFWEYFGTTALSDTNLDSGGIYTLGDDYDYGYDPNVINFSILETNNYINSLSASVQLNITNGVPSYYAVLVNDPNPADASWQPYVSSNLNVFLGTSDGTYNVSIGLRGLPPNATQTWQGETLILDTVAPVVVLTNLASLSGSRPFIDPAGYANKALSSLTFKVTNSQGTVAADQGLVTDQDCNPADMCHTTNRFVCLDVALTLGTNYIAINVVDWAGNVTTTNFSYVFDTNGDTTPPAIGLLWPQNGMKISGNSFTLRGTVDDDTATVAGQWTDANGVAQTIGGSVERGGQFWLQNLPLNPGTNAITVTATDAAGNVTTTNLNLIQSSVTLTLDAVDASLLNRVRVNVTGAISDPTYAVWINGVQGTNDGTGHWSASNVPVTAGGTASFDLTGYPPGEVPTGNSWTNFAVEQAAYPNAVPADTTQASASEDKPEVVYVKQLIWNSTGYIGWTAIHVDQGTATENWSQGGGGSFHDTGSHTNVYGHSDASTADLSWAKDAGLVPTLPVHYDYSEYTNGGFYRSAEGDNANYYGFPFVADFLPLTGYFEHVAGSGQYPTNAEGWLVPDTWADSAEYVVNLFTGGKALRQDKSLFILSQSLTWTAADDFDGGQIEQVGDVPAQQIALDSLGTLDSDGTLTKALDNGQHVAITPHTTKPYSFVYGVVPGKGKYTLTSRTWYPALTNTNLDRTTIGVGEQVDLSGMPDSATWSTSAGDLSGTNGSGVTLTAPNNKATATVTATYKTASLAIPFKVVEPACIDHAQIIATNHYSIGVAGVGMQTYVWIAPTSVSFYRVNIMEVGEDASGISGYFTQWTPQQLHHNTADHWSPLNADNQFQDEAFHSFYPSPWAAGSFMWDIPARWQVIGSGATNSMTGWNQTVSIDAAGTMTVQKFSHSVTRTTNDVITTN